MSFAGKVVIVTGASSGIGASTGILFSHSGANVVLVGRNESKLKNVAEKCNQGGTSPLVVKADVGNDSDVERIINETVKKYGKLDILVNNAGIVVRGSVLNGNLVEGYDETMKVNVRAVIKLTILAAPYLIKTKGNIVNVSSIEGKKPSMINHLPYMVSKAALDHFTRGAALELAPFGVRVNSVSPGPVRTDILENSGMSPSVSWDDIAKIMILDRVSDPEEIGELILYLASDKARGISGSDFVNDNGALLGTKAKPNIE
ncbi:3-oxoacyl-[acyl-carrier-protein] reductase FabG-like [Amyelois transitella]|uniref:3-oxoacyl-[acyl-carrier-protein] reductase FabG-like n=1 Tax=Amyelois transitella TaxID=680683 RepID=UPI00067C90BB|nr:3-oxoacyl-[acyl-carrier-protein] reductase FabG-like [Amyelois transitella]